MNLLMTLRGFSTSILKLCIMPISRGEIYNERIKLKEDEFPNEKQVFEDRGWNQLMKLGVCNESLVREFYANVVLNNVEQVASIT